MTPKLTDQFRRLLEDCLNQFNNAVQVKIFNKFSVSFQLCLEIINILLVILSINLYLCHFRFVIHHILMLAVYYIPIVSMMDQEYLF